MCDCQSKRDALVPQIAVITKIRQDTDDVRTFRVEKPTGGRCFDYLPGQCAIISVPGLGEAIFSITSSPTNKEALEFSIKRCGRLTDYLHGVEAGQQIAIRGPYGNSFPVEGELKNKNLLFIAGGIGLAPLHSVINYALDNRDGYGSLDVVFQVAVALDEVGHRDVAITALALGPCHDGVAADFRVARAPAHEIQHPSQESPAGRKIPASTPTSSSSAIWANMRQRSV